MKASNLINLLLDCIIEYGDKEVLIISNNDTTIEPKIILEKGIFIIKSQDDS